MLSAAHVLAMDSKNLLDVVDTIRIRHPQIDRQIFKSNDSLPESDQTHESSASDRPETDQAAYPIAASMASQPISCSFMPLYANNIQAVSASNLSSNDSDS